MLHFDHMNSVFCVLDAFEQGSIALATPCQWLKINGLSNKCSWNARFHLF